MHPWECTLTHTGCNCLQPHLALNPKLYYLSWKPNFFTCLTSNNFWSGWRSPFLSSQICFLIFHIMESWFLVVHVVTHKSIFSHLPCAVLTNGCEQKCHGAVLETFFKKLWAHYLALQYPPAAKWRWWLVLKSSLTPRTEGLTLGIADQTGEQALGPWGLSGGEPR